MPEYVKALYAYEPQAAEYMQFAVGHQIEIVEKLSADWARGKNVQTNKAGVFPLKYVKEISEKDVHPAFSHPAAPLPPQASGQSQQGNHASEEHSESSTSSYVSKPEAFDEKQSYSVPPQPSWQNPAQHSQAPPQYQSPTQQQQTPQQQWGPPQQQWGYSQQQVAPQQSYPMQMMMPQQPQQQVQQPEHRHEHHFGQYARRFGDSVLFGAGSRLGSDIMGKII